MNQPKAKPEHFAYLVKLRDSAATNMWGAGPFLAREFKLTELEADCILIEWMESFNNKEAKAPAS